MLERILVPLDPLAPADPVLPIVTMLAKGLDQPVVLLAVLVPVVGEGGELHPKTSAFDADIAALMEHRAAVAQRMLDGVRDRLAAAGVRAASVVATGPVAETIVHTAEAQGAGVIAMATHGRAAPERWFLGSVSDKVARTSPVPVLVVRPSGQAAVVASITRVLLPLDGSDLAETAIPYAAYLARAFYVPVTVIRTVQMSWVGVGGTSTAEPGMSPELIQMVEDEAKQYLSGIVARLRADGVDAEPHYAPFVAPATGIVDLAAKTPGAIIVMTSHGRSGLSRAVLGSVAGRVIRSAGVPVLVVRGAEVSGS